MRITEVTLEPLRLEMVNPLKTARGTYAAREGFVVRLRDEEGRVGQGEAMPLREFGTESPSDCERALKSINQLPLPLGEGRGEGMCHPLGLTLRTPAARHAVEQALLDLLAQRQGVPLCRLLSAEAREEVRVNALLGASSPEALAEESRRAVAEGYETLKLKVAGRPLAEDVARLSAVRDAVGRDIRLRVDANGGWTESEAGPALFRLGEYHLELCEQPVAAEDHEALARLSEHAPCPLAADESLALPEVLRALLDYPRTVGILVLKPMVLGGLLPALSLAREAAKKGLEAYVTSSLDGVIARAGAAHLAAALPSGRYASGLGVGHLFKDEPGSHPFRPVRGRIELPRTPGQGVN
ncbi:o-succinylbenzoate synthase [Archangium violaceum]|uniref:mandelate racemase/muconate lactonizing enzyme family protein n=1 Tax=Archangium violaceum TaxID=83451 RepID=UPI00193B9295|nr:enolase C-terminal domain-like protein [Archangium violaceum]QRK06133.1 o-succinylbenzoate synthase [Archangium violaceum]